MLQTVYYVCKVNTIKSFFSKSEKKIRPGLFSSSVLSIILKSSRMFSPIYLPFMNLVCELLIIVVVITCFTRFAMALVAIL